VAAEHPRSQQLGATGLLLGATVATGQEDDREGEGDGIRHPDLDDQDSAK